MTIITITSLVILCMGYTIYQMKTSADANLEAYLTEPIVDIPTIITKMKLGKRITIDHGVYLIGSVYYGYYIHPTYVQIDDQDPILVSREQYFYEEILQPKMKECGLNLKTLYKNDVGVLLSNSYAVE